MLGQPSPLPTPYNRPMKTLTFPSFGMRLIKIMLILVVLGVFFAAGMPNVSGPTYHHQCSFGVRLMLVSIGLLYATLCPFV